MTTPFGSGQQTWPGDPTMPSASPVGYMTPSLPNPSRNEPPLTAAQIAAKRNSFYELIIREVVKAVQGFFIPGGGSSSDQLANWAAEVGTGVNQLIDGIAQFIVKLPLIDDFIEVWSQKEDGDLNDLGSAVNRFIHDIRSTVDSIVSGLFGWIGNGWNNDQAAQALIDVAATQAALTAAVQAMQNTQANQAVSGVSAVVDFSDRANSGSLGANFNQTYALSGTGVWGITNGRAAWQPQNNSDRRSDVLYSPTPSATDYQMVGAAFATSPEHPFLSNDPAYNMLKGRMNLAQSSYVYAALRKSHAELGCVVSGAPTIFAQLTSGFSFKSTGLYWLRCGTPGGLRVFQIMEGTTPILTHTEVGTTSQLGASFRYTGMAVYAYANSVGTNNPGQVAAWAFADNQPPNFKGSGAEMYRASTGTVTATNGLQLLPTSFFDTVSDHTTDITVDPVGGSFAVTIEGWYRVSARIRISTGFPNRLMLVLYKNGAVNRRGGADYGRMVDATLSIGIPRGISGSWLVYMFAGDYVQLGYDADQTASNTFAGIPSGFETFFTIALVNRSQT